MNQWMKTGVFALVALFCVAIAWIAQPRPIGDTDETSEIGKDLFPEFDNPLEVQSLEIVYADPEATLGGDKVNEFKVAKVAKDGEDGEQWIIPSRQKYPADAEDKIAAVANSLIGLEVIQIASETREDHQELGVEKPDPAKSSVENKGAGKMVVMKDKKDNDLAAIIIGAKVKGTDNQHFVRRPGQDRVFTVSIDDEVFSTKFDDWIERDLLDLEPSKVQQVTIRDYSVQRTMNFAGQLVPDPKTFQQRLEMTLNWDQGDSKWKLGEIRENRDGRMVASEMLDDEELNTSKLSDMKNALDKLEIVDVQRKPKGLGANLQATEELQASAADMQDLALRGFFPVRRGGKLDMISTDGEMLIKTEDSVEYVLRFGEVAGMSADGDETQLNRYLLVTARLDEEALAAEKPEMPNLEELAEEEKEEDSTEAPGDTSTEEDGAATGEDAPDAAKASDENDADANGDADASGDTDAKPAVEPDATESSGETSDAGDSDSDTNGDDAKAGDTAKPTSDADAAAGEDSDTTTAEPGPPAPQGAEGTEGEEGAGEDKAETDSAEAAPADSATESSDADETAAAAAAEAPAEADKKDGDAADGSAEEAAAEPAGDAPADAGEDTADAGEDTADAGEDTADAGEDTVDTGDGTADTGEEADDASDASNDLEARQQEALKEYQRKLDDYNDKQKEAQKKVIELNARFADWYFVISDDVYKKIRLSRSDAIKEKESAKEEGSGVDAFRGLEGGIEKN